MHRYNEEAQILDQGGMGNWALTSQGICLVDFKRSPGPAIKFFSFDSRQLTTNLREPYRDKHLGDLASRVLLAWHSDQHVDVEGGDRERPGPVIIKQHLVDDDAAAGGQALEAFVRQRLTPIRRSVVKNHPVVE